jgi:hypothetical protein
MPSPQAKHLRFETPEILHYVCDFAQDDMHPDGGLTLQMFGEHRYPLSSILYPLSNPT